MCLQSGAMVKGKIEGLEGLSNGVKRPLHGTTKNGPPQKKMKALLENDSNDEDSSASSQSGGVVVHDSGAASNGGDLKINEKYARRFEYNKKREEFDRRKNLFGGLCIHIG